VLLGDKADRKLRYSYKGRMINTALKTQAKKESGLNFQKIVTDRFGLKLTMGLGIFPINHVPLLYKFPAL
jgi:hypothetical protein